MGRNDSNKPNKKEGLWSRKFDDEEESNEQDYYSRTERKKADKNVSPIMTSLLIFLALFIILPTAVYLWYSNSAEKENQSMGPDNNIIITQNESSRTNSESLALEEKAEETKKEASERKEKERLAEAEQKEKQRETVEKDKQSKEQEESKQQEQEESKQQEQEESRQKKQEQEEMEKGDTNNEQQTGSTYTVKPGDNLYRIALNHGMTTDELKTLNNISGNEISVGTVLKVK